MDRNKKICNKCNRNISYSNYNKHYNSCKGINTNRLVVVDNNWLHENGKYSCPYCNKFFSKMGICSHIILAHLNVEKQKYNLVDYNEKIKSGVLLRNKNQFELAKERGENYIISSEQRKKMSDRKIGTHVSNKTREKLSKIRSIYLEEVGNGGFKNIKWFNVQNIKGENYIVRGNWEKELSEILNAENIYWIRKKYINYLKENVFKTYCPDFYLPEYDVFIEVKGYFSQIDKEKINLVIEQNTINLLMVFDKDLKIIRNIGFKKYWDVSALSYTQ